MSISSPSEPMRSIRITGWSSGKKKVLEERWIEVDEKTYQKMLREGKIEDDGLSVEDMVIMDMFLD